MSSEKNIRKELSKHVLDQDAKIIAVVGARNQGKTFLIKLLIDCGKSEHIGLSKDEEAEKARFVPDSALVSTPGLMTMSTHIKGISLIFVDTHGRDDAVPQINWGDRNSMINSMQYLRDTKLVESFEQKMMAEFAPNLVFVIGQMTRRDQEHFLQYVSEKGSRRQTIFVVHNWRHVHTAQDFKIELDKISNIIGVSRASLSKSGKTVVNSVPRQSGTKIVIEGLDDKQSVQKAEIVSSEGHYVIIEITSDLKSCLATRLIPLEQWDNMVGDRKIYEDLSSGDQDKIQTACRLEYEDVSLVEIKEMVENLNKKNQVEQASWDFNDFPDGIQVPHIHGERYGSVTEMHFFFVNMDNSAWTTVYNAASANRLRERLKNTSERITTREWNEGTSKYDRPKHVGVVNVAAEFCRTIERVAPDFFTPKDSSQSQPLEVSVKIKKSIKGDERFPEFSWPYEKTAAADLEARNLAFTAYTYQFRPERIADAVMKPFRVIDDVIALKDDGFEIAISDELWMEPLTDVNERKYLHVQLIGDWIWDPKNTDFDADPQIEKVSKILKHTKFGGRRELQWHINTPGVDDDADVGVFADFVSGREVLKFDVSELHPKEPDLPWELVTSREEKAALCPRMSAESGCMHFPCPAKIDDKEKKMEIKDGVMTIIASEQAQPKRIGKRKGGKKTEADANDR